MTGDLKAREHRFRGDQTADEAAATLRAAAHDKEGEHGSVRLAAASALLDLRTGRSVQSTMARFRRSIGLDAPKGRKAQ